MLCSQDNMPATQGINMMQPTLPCHVREANRRNFSSGEPIASLANNCVNNFSMDVLPLRYLDLVTNEWKATCSFSSRSIYQTTRRHSGAEISARTSQAAQKVLTALVSVLVLIPTTLNARILLLRYTIVSSSIAFPHSLREL